MESGRRKKGKKTGWHLTLGLKDAIFAGIGIVGLMMMSFAVGTLAGRGDIYRIAYSWGLLRPNGPKVVQWVPPLGPAAVAPLAAPGTVTAPTVAAVTPAPIAAPLSHPTAAVAAKAGRTTPVTGSVAALPPPAAAKKKAKTGNLHRNHKSREAELQRLRRQMVSKLKFQNSFDTNPKPRSPKSKEHEKAQAKAKTIQVRVAQYRNSREAQAKVAELHRKGIKATYKKTKDSKGAWYTVYKLTAPAQIGAEKLAQKPEKSGRAARKPKPRID